MAGVMDHRDVGIPRLLGEIAQRAPHFGIFQIARDPTTSNAAFLNISVMAAASLAGLMSAAAFW
jgi:hypothetical protein